MDFKQAIQSGFSNYTNFGSRAAHSEFWYWQLFGVIGGIAAELLDLVLTFWRLRFPFFTLGLAILARDDPRSRGHGAQTSRHRPQRLVAFVRLNPACRHYRADRLVV